MRTYIISYTHEQYLSVPVRAPSLEAAEEFFDQQMTRKGGSKPLGSVVEDDSIYFTEIEEADEEQLSGLYNPGEILTVNDKGEVA